MYKLTCMNCNIERELTKESFYEAKRLNRTLCRACSLKIKEPRGSKYDKLVKRGDVYNLWTIVGDRVTQSESKILCKCICGIEKYIRVSSLISNKSKGCSRCIRKGKTSANWKGLGDFPKSAFTKIKLSAKFRQKEFAISHEYLNALYEAQFRKCSLSGLPLYFIENGKSLAESMGNASLDRIDNSLGYVEGNVQWVHKDINFMKQTYTNAYFKQLCKLVTENG